MRAERKIRPPPRGGPPSVMLGSGRARRGGVEELQHEQRARGRRFCVLERGSLQYRDEGSGKVLGEFDLRGAHQTEPEKRSLLVGVWVMVGVWGDARVACGRGSRWGRAARSASSRRTRRRSA